MALYHPRHPQTLPTLREVFYNICILDMEGQTDFFQLDSSHIGLSTHWFVWTWCPHLSVVGLLNARCGSRTGPTLPASELIDLPDI